MKRPLGYVDGIATGIAVIALVVSVVLALWTQQLELIYREIGPGARISGMTQLVLGSAFRVGVPFAIAASLVAGHVWRPKYLLVIVAVLAIAVDVFWYRAAYGPIFDLAGNIR